MSESAIAQAGKPEVRGGNPVIESILGFVTLALACFATTWCPEDGPGRDLAWFVFVGAWVVLAAFIPSIFPAKGSRTAFVLGGIFFLAVFCIALALLGWMETSAGQQSFLISAVLVVVATIATRLFVSRFLTRPAVADLEDQGWTSMGSYKRVQGQRVRRLTMITLIVTAVTGAMTLINAGYGSRWFAEVPYTGKVEIVDPQNGRYTNPPLRQGDRFSREEFQRLQSDLRNKVLVGGEAVTATVGGAEATYRPGDLIPRELATQVRNALREGRREGDSQDLSTTDVVLPETKKVDQLGLMILPGNQLKVVALSLLGFFLVWRLVNVPSFADFLIATDSEMSKVSWPPFKKLWRDTLVVVAGMFLMGGMIMAIDWVWRGVLTSISVLQFPSTPDDKNRSEDLKPWPAARETAAAAATAEQKK